MTRAAVSVADAEAMDETDEEDFNKKSPPRGLKSQRRQCQSAIRPTAGVDVDQQGPGACDHHRRHRPVGVERAPLIVGERERMVRHRITPIRPRRPRPRFPYS